MGANKGALVALQALGGVPAGQCAGNSTFIVLGGSQWIGAVLVGQERGHGQIVAPLTVTGNHNLLHHIGQILIHRVVIGGLRPDLGNLYLHGAVDAGVHSGQIHADDLLTLLGIGLSSSLLHIADGLLHRHDIGQFEECGLQNQIGVVAEAQLPGYPVGVHGVKLYPVISNILFHIAGQVPLQFLAGPGSVQQESTAVLDLVDHIIAGNVRLGVACQEVRSLDEIGGTDRAFAETQVAFGDAIGFLGVVLKVRLGVHPGVITDDLGRVLVGAYRAVGTKTPEFATDSVPGLSNEGFLHIQAQVGHIVHHTDGKHLPGLL